MSDIWVFDLILSVYPRISQKLTFTRERVGFRSRLKFVLHLKRLTSPPTPFARSRPPSLVVGKELPLKEKKTLPGEATADEPSPRAAPRKKKHCRATPQQTGPPAAPKKKKTLLGEATADEPSPQAAPRKKKTLHAEATADEPSPQAAPKKRNSACRSHCRRAAPSGRSEEKENSAGRSHTADTQRRCCTAETENDRGTAATSAPS
jgi:hypothetical protein